MPSMHRRIPEHGDHSTGILIADIRTGAKQKLNKKTVRMTTNKPTRLYVAEGVFRETDQGCGGGGQGAGLVGGGPQDGGEGGAAARNPVGCLGEGGGGGIGGGDSVTQKENTTRAFGEVQTHQAVPYPEGGELTPRVGRTGGRSRRAGTPPPPRWKRGGPTITPKAGTAFVLRKGTPGGENASEAIGENPSVGIRGSLFAPQGPHPGPFQPGVPLRRPSFRAPRQGDQRAMGRPRWRVGSVPNSLKGTHPLSGWQRACPSAPTLRTPPPPSTPMKQGGPPVFPSVPAELRKHST